MKNVLFFAPPFFNYPEIIKQELDLKCDNVAYYKTTPSSSLYKLSWYLDNFHLNSGFKKWLECSLFRRIIEKLSKDPIHYNYIFAIKGSLLPDFFYEWLKKKYPTASFIQYLWDDVCNDSQSLVCRQHFDRIYSYNPQDCEKYGFKLRPFFFQESFLSNKENRKYPISCIMSYSDDRANILNTFKGTPLFQSQNFIFIKGSYILKYTSSAVGCLSKYIKPRGLSYKQMMNILADSRCQLDIQHPSQCGLTTRAFETLATKTKLITTNSNICQYDFYNKSNIYIIDRNNPVIDWSWIEKPYIEISEDVLRRYSLSYFLDEILFEENITAR